MEHEKWIHNNIRTNIAVNHQADRRSSNTENRTSAADRIHSQDTFASSTSSGVDQDAASTGHIVVQESSAELVAQQKLAAEDT